MRESSVLDLPPSPQLSRLLGSTVMKAEAVTSMHLTEL